MLVNLDSTKPQSWEWKWEEDVLIAVNRGGAAGGEFSAPSMVWFRAREFLVGQNK